MKLLLTLSLITVLLLPNYAIPQCPTGVKSVKSIKLEDLAPCGGYYVDTASLRTMQNSHSKVTQERDKYKKALELSDLQVTKTQQQKALWEAEAKKQGEALQKTKRDFQYGLIVGFGLALVTVIATGYALKAAGR